MQQLKIANFQAIGKAKLKFVPGLNVIIGPNDQGKSAIIRALRWVYRDAFTGTWFAKDGEARCAVAVKVDSDTIVVRDIERKLTDAGKTDRLVFNKYSIRTRGADPQEYDKFRELPEEVQSALQVSKPIVLGKGADEVIDLNFADQHRDAIFLMNRPGSITARLLSYIIGLNPVIQGMRELATRQRNRHRDIKQLSGRRDELDEAIRQFPADKLKREFAVLDSKVAAVRELQERHKSISELGDDLRITLQAGREAQRTNTALSKLLKLPWGEAEELLERQSILTVIHADYEQAHEDLEEGEADVGVLGESLDGVDELLGAWESKVESMVAYQGAVDDLSNSEETLEQCTADLEIVGVEYHELLDELGICPTCGKEVNA